MKRHILFLTFLLLSCFSSAQQIDLWTQHNGRMSFTMFGNTLNLAENGIGVPCTIATSSSANLNLSANQTLVAAYLYWAGSGTGDFNVSFQTNNVTSDRTFSLTDNGRVYFAAMADITPIIAASGNGNYTLADFDLTAVIGNYCNTGTNFGGWSVIVVYEEPTLPLNSVKIYDGLERISGTNPNITINLDNILVVNPAGSRLGFLAWEGDRGIAVTEEARINGNILSSPVNPPNNNFNGTNSFTGSNTLFNMDLDFYDIANFVNVGDQIATVNLRSGQDFVMINAVPLALNNELPDATITLDNLVNDDCDDRILHVDYTVGNFDATDILPMGTNIRFYMNDINGQFLAEDFTSIELPIDGSEMRSIDIAIPASAGQDFDIFAVVNEDGAGNRIILELDPDNNNDIESGHIIEPSSFTQNPVICEYEFFELPDGSEVNTAQTYVNTLAGANADGCDSVVTTHLTVNPRPLANPTTDQECSDTNTATFDLNSLIPKVNGGVAGVTVTYHTSQANADEGLGALPANYTTTSGSVFARVVNNNTTCINTSEVVLTVNANPEANDAAQAQCSNTALADFDLAALVATVDGGLPGRTVSFHTTQALADTGGSPLPLTYNANTSTIFARVVNDATECFATSQIDLTVNANPAVNDAAIPLVNCSSSGTAEFFLPIAEDDITGGATGVTVTYHSTQGEATSGMNALPNDYSSSNGTIYTRVTNNATSCFATGTLELTVIDNPPNPTQNIPECSSTSEATFDISSIEDALIADIVNITVTFHPTSMDASNNTAVITNTTNYITSSTSVYARVQAIYQNITCYSVAEIVLTVNANPEAFNATLDECSNTNEATFDLTEASDTVTGGTDDRGVHFYETMADATADTNEITAAYTSVSKTIFAKVINTNTTCESITEVALNVIGNPVFPSFSIQQCFIDKTVNFQLGDELIQLETNHPDLDFSFHGSLDDAFNDVNPLPAVFPSNDITIFVRVKWASNDCFIVVPVSLETIETPQENRRAFYCVGKDFTLPDGTVVNETGVYSTTILQGGCDYLIETTLFEAELDFPSAFTPNRNGENDCFRALPGLECRSNVTDFRLEVYNRWGELVWTANNYLECWDGQWEGAPAAAGFYLWWATYTFKGEVREREGGVTLIR